MLQIKKELNAIGNNFNQAVHKLHTLDRIPEFRAWIMLYEATKQSIDKTIMHTSIQMHEIYQHLQTKPCYINLKIKYVEVNYRKIK